jgi:hypothetical protein
MILFFISCADLLAKLTASVYLKYSGWRNARSMYSRASVRVFPEPAEDR